MNNRFSALSIDQVQKLENAKVKDNGGAICITENTNAFESWMMAGPEQARLLSEFEKQYLPELGINYNHHEEYHGAQVVFHRQVSNLIAVFGGYENPFDICCPDLLVLNTHCCLNRSVIFTVREIETMGSKQ